MAGALLLAALLAREWRGVLAPVARVLGVSLALLALAELGAGTLVLPERTALVFLPFAALLLAAAPPFVPAAAGTLATALLALWLPRAAEPSPGALLARLLEAPARAGRRVLAAGYWGPELDYRLARAGAPGRVVLFPSAVAAHPGWYREEEIHERDARGRGGRGSFGPAGADSLRPAARVARVGRDRLAPRTRAAAAVEPARRRRRDARPVGSESARV